MEKFTSSFATVSLTDGRIIKSDNFDSSNSELKDIGEKTLLFNLQNGSISQKDYNKAVVDLQKTLTK